MPAGDGFSTGAGAVVPAPDPFGRSEPPLLALTLWPHRSLTRKGFRTVLGMVAAGLTVPLVPLVGTSAAWGLLPFLVGALIALYLAIRRSYRDGTLREELRLWPDLITVERREPKGTVRRWHANPFWVRLKLARNARIENYLTLEGNGREIELGAFLSPDERVALHHDLAEALGEVRGGRAPA